jgi:hypothetical protein
MTAAAHSKFQALGWCWVGKSSAVLSSRERRTAQKIYGAEIDRLGSRFEIQRFLGACDAAVGVH